MLYKKKGYPVEDELVLCTVNSVQPNGVFASLDEYEKGGMIHISEIAPGRIRNIRDYVVEGKKIVCKVLKINTERGHIDLSLRRVNEGQRREKIDVIKQEQVAEKIVENVANKLKLDVKKLYEELLQKSNYGRLFPMFEDAVKGNVKLEQLDIDKKIVEELVTGIGQRIAKPEVEIKGDLKLRSYSADGIEIIKAALKKAEDNAKGMLEMRYKGGGDFKVVLKAEDYKTAEKVLKSSIDAVIEHMRKNKGEAEFVRQEA